MSANLSNPINSGAEWHRKLCNWKKKQKQKTKRKKWMGSTWKMYELHEENMSTIAHTLSLGSERYSESSPAVISLLISYYSVAQQISYLYAVTQQISSFVSCYTTTSFRRFRFVSYFRLSIPAMLDSLGERAYPSFVHPWCFQSIQNAFICFFLSCRLLSPRDIFLIWPPFYFFFPLIFCSHHQFQARGLQEIC